MIAIDGKTSRRTHDQVAGKKALHLVSAWAVENRLVLAQLATEEKSNEITAIPLLLQQLALEGGIVTIDAMGTQTKIAQQIIEQQGAYALALKENHGTLYDEVQATFTMAGKETWTNEHYASDRTLEKAHGRLEIRDSWTISDPEILAYLDPEHRWKGLRGIGMVQAKRRMEHEITKETPTFCSVFLP